jgi:SAM-dependent methyltransferase
MDDSRLLAHYLEVGHEPWNSSPEAAYLEFRTRAWIRGGWPAGPVRAVNVGIGAGRWDDYLGHLAMPDGEITSVDIDPAICELLQYRQRREAHPRPARVLCGDLLQDALPAGAFDVVTAIGSTLREIVAAIGGDRDRPIRSLSRLVAPRGQLFLHGDQPTADPAWLCPAVERCGLRVAEVVVDEQIAAMPQVLLRACAG